jgi:hypothetical protein
MLLLMALYLLKIPLLQSLMSNLIHLVMQLQERLQKGALGFPSLAAMILSTAAATAFAKVTGSGPSLGWFARLIFQGDLVLQAVL